MIESNSVKVLIKDRFQTSGTKLSKESLNRLQVPRIFSRLHCGELPDFRKKEDFLETIQLSYYCDCQGTSVISDYRGRSASAKVIILESTCDTNRLCQPSPRITRAPIHFAVRDKEGVRFTLAGFWPEAAFLAVCSIPEGTELDPEMSKIINEIFSFIRKEGFKRIYFDKSGVKKKFKIGADPEFSLLRNGDRVAACEILKGGTSSRVGTDGCSSTGELRPAPCDNPFLFVKKEIVPLLKELKGLIPSNVKVTSGGGFRDPLGGHIHFNKTLSNEEITLLDDFLGIPLSKIKGGARCGGGTNSGYGHPSDVRAQPHGSEYRTAPSVLFPEITEAKFVLAYCIVKKWENTPIGKKIEYRINQNGIPTKESYIALAPTKKFIPMMETFYKWVTTGEFNNKEDILEMWFGKREEGVKAITPRINLVNLPAWFPKMTKISYPNLKKPITATVQSYGSSISQEFEEEIPSGAIIIDIPINIYQEFETREEQRNAFFEKVSNLLNTHIVIKISSSDTIGILFPHTWREVKRKVFTKPTVRTIFRMIVDFLPKED